jgi:adenylosuccinate lyase
MSLPTNALHTASVQGFERTLDDSANRCARIILIVQHRLYRRIILPDAFLCAEAMLTTAQNIFAGMSINAAVIERHVREELPFLALEKVMMRLTSTGVSRQTAHEKIREVSLGAQRRRDLGESVELMAMLEGDEFFDGVG